MPMVGTEMASVTARATPSGTASRTTAKQPASASATASSTRAAAAAACLPWTLKPPRAWMDWGVRPTWPITGTSASTMALIMSTRLRPPSSLTAWAPARINVAALRTVSETDTW